MKEGFLIIIINKNEAFVLRKSGFGEHVHNGHGTYRRFYLTTNGIALKFLRDYRDSIKVK